MIVKGTLNLSFLLPAHKYHTRFKKKQQKNYRFYYLLITYHI